tara:strand:+ start:2569 stop:3045 length:477 start_codon:yes stop_codon:yes gene_type:complete
MKNYRIHERYEERLNEGPKWEAFKKGVGKLNPFKKKPKRPSMEDRAEKMAPLAMNLNPTAAEKAAKDAKSAKWKADTQAKIDAKSKKARDGQTVGSVLGAAIKASGPNPVDTRSDALKDAEARTKRQQGTIPDRADLEHPEHKRVYGGGKDPRGPVRR